MLDTENSNTSEEHILHRDSPITPTNSATKSKVNMVELARIITRETEIVDRYLRESGSEQPGFDVDSPANFPKLPADIKKAREEVVRATKELSALVTGPTESIRWMAWDVSFLHLFQLHGLY